VTAAEDVLEQVLHAVSAALLTGDPRPVAETSAWVSELMQTRGVAVARVRELAAIFAAALCDYPRARELVEQNFTGGLA
jgi:hypothetical protein